MFVNLQGDIVCMFLLTPSYLKLFSKTYYHNTKIIFNKNKKNRYIEKKYLKNRTKSKITETYIKRVTNKYRLKRKKIFFCVLLLSADLFLIVISKTPVIKHFYLPPND